MWLDAFLEMIKIWLTGLLRGSAFYILIMAFNPKISLTSLQALLCVLAGIFWEYANEK